jgi:hypothetical protein
MRKIKYFITAMAADCHYSKNGAAEVEVKKLGFD